MSPFAFAILCFAGGVILLIAEVMLPSHGVLGVLGAVALVAGVVACFWIDQYLGLAAAVAVVAAAPFAAALWVKVWPHTYAGKRLILAPPPPADKARGDAALAVRPMVHVGQGGVVVSELRPGGVCDFGGGVGRVSARCEHGTLPAGAAVEVVAVVDGHPVVRAV